MREHHVRLREGVGVQLPCATRQIVRVLAEAEAGMMVRDVCRKHNVSEQSFYRWKAKYGGMDVSEVKRLKELERENSELKHIVAELTLYNRMLKDINQKKW